MGKDEGGVSIPCRYLAVCPHRASGGARFGVGPVYRRALYCWAELAVRCCI
jgi:hypothetical protein